MSQRDSAKVNAQRSCCRQLHLMRGICNALLILSSDMYSGNRFVAKTKSKYDLYCVADWFIVVVVAG